MYSDLVHEDTSSEKSASGNDDAYEISEYAVSALNRAVGAGLMKGKSTETINPKDNATRAEIAAIFQRFMAKNN